MMYLMVYKYIVLILMSPVLALLSEKTESIIKQRDFPFKMGQFLKEILRGIFIAIRNFVMEILLTALLLILMYVPLIGLLSPFIIFMVQSYFYGFSMMDYYNERHKKSISESSHFIWRHKGIAIANGAGFYALLIIPVIGLLLAPTYSIVAATLSVLEVEESNYGS